MLFSELPFLYCFLPMVLLLCRLAPSLRARNALLLTASLLFYGWGQLRCLPLLLLVAASDWFLARVVQLGRGGEMARLALCVSLVLDFSVLALFKYSGLLLRGFGALAGEDFSALALIQPIGISFYLFKSTSYVIDVYRGEAEATRSYAEYLLYLSLFFELMAGPITRWNTLAPALREWTGDTATASSGATRFVWGLCKKLLLADHAGKLAGVYLSAAPASLTVGAAWCGILLYGLQVFFDFAAYSDMAIGLGAVLGFSIPENFIYPYCSRSISEFWRRWHISLGSWFRDYLYIPLGGNRRRLYRNLFVVWLATGLWHGGSLNFVLWGLYYGALIALERAFLGRWLEKLPALFGHAYALFFVMLGWVFFYFAELTEALAYLKTALGLAGQGLWDFQLTVALYNNCFWLIAAALLCTPLLPTLWKKLPQKAPALFGGLNALAPVGTLALLLLCTAMIASGSYQAFLYFKF